MKRVVLLIIPLSVFLSSVLPADAQTNRPSVFPHGIVVTNEHAVTGVFNKIFLRSTFFDAAEVRVNDLRVVPSGIIWNGMPGRAIWFSTWSVDTTQTMGQLSADLLDGIDSAGFARVVTNFPATVTSAPQNAAAVTIYESDNYLLVWSPNDQRWKWVPLQSGTNWPF